MLFSSSIFIFAFLPIVILVYYMIRPELKNSWLFVSSLFFYAWGEPKFVLIMLLSIVINYILGMLADRYRETKNGKMVIVLTIVLNLSIFFYFKYLNFTIYNLNSFFHTSIPQTNILLPIGISFFTFQAMSYVFDVYKGNGSVQKNPFYVGLYIMFFPQLIAGPIVRYETVAKEIRSRNETMQDFSIGIERFIIGLGKKVILSNQWAILADYSFGINQSGNLDSVNMAWIGAIAYTFQIFFDFSGYSDMAIGLGRMFGFHFLENFNYPYASSSVTDFWRRWHISLGSWFRDYVYIPLGGSRVTRNRMIFNLFAVWSLTGIWHGASWNFIFWGLGYFLLLVFEKLTGIPQKLNNRFLRILYRVWTLLCIIIGWVLFRAPNLSQAWDYIRCMFSFQLGTTASYANFLLNDNFVLLSISLLLSVPAINMLKTRIKLNVKFAYCVNNLIVPIGLLCILFLSISFVINSSYDPFIYFNF